MTTVTITNLGPNAVGISESGTVTGYARDGGFFQSYLISNGVTTYFPGYASAGPISENGEWVGGNVYNVSQGNAAYWQNGTLYTVPQTISEVSGVVGIDNNGDIAGFLITAGGVSESFFQAQGGAFTIIGSLNNAPDTNNFLSQVLAMNDSGQVVGYAGADSYGTQQAFLWQNGTMTELAILPGSTNSAAFGLNDEGVIVGSSHLPGTLGTAVMWSNGAVTALAALPGAQGSTAEAINDQNQIVGNASMNDGSQHAVLWQNGTATDLNSLLPANSGWVLNDAYAINDQGMIVGRGTYDGVQADFLLDLDAPVPALPAVQAFVAGTLTAPAQISAAASDVAGNLDALQSMAAAGLLKSITLTDGGTPTLSISDKQIVKDTGALNAVAGDFTVSVAATDANIDITGLTGHSTIVDFSAPGSSYLVTYAEGVFTVNNLSTSQISIDTLNGVTAVKFSDGTEILPAGANATAKIVDLGDYSGNNELTALALDGQGDVVGISSQSTIAASQLGVYWAGGQFTPLTPLLSQNENGSEGYAISSDGWAVGDSQQLQGTFSSANPGGPPEAVLWKAGNYSEPVDLGRLSGDVASIATGINASHQIIGISYASTTVIHAFLWQNGTMSTIGSLGGSETYALQIDDAGQIVGYGTTASGADHAFLWQNGTMTDLGTLSGGTGSTAASINQTGLIVGYSTDVGGATQAVTWANGKIAELAGLPAGGSSLASGVNDSGAIVGSSDGHAVIWTDGTVIDLNSLLPVGSGWTLTSATAINDEGDVIGQGTDNGASAAFELTLPALLPVSAVTASLNFLDGSVSGPVTVTDTAADIGTNIDGLERLAAAHDLGGIVLTDSGVPVLALTSAQMVSDSPVLSAIGGDYVLSISAADHGATVTGLTGHGNILAIDGDAAQYQVTANGAGFTLTGAAGSDQLTDIQAIQFSDYTDIVADRPGGANAVTTGNLTELYAAILDRKPDVSGLAYYQAALAANPSTPLTTFAEFFLSAAEYTGNPAHDYAQTTAGEIQFITGIYQNLLGRAPDSGAVPFYLNVIDQITANLAPGTAAYAKADLQAHATVLTYISQSAEFLGDVQVTAATPSDAHHWLILV